MVKIKKSKKRTTTCDVKKNNMIYMSIVSIVAIVAIVLLIMNFTGSDDSALVVDEEGNIVGEAFRSSLLKSSKATAIESKITLPSTNIVEKLREYNLASYTCVDTDTGMGLPDSAIKGIVKVMDGNGNVIREYHDHCDNFVNQIDGSNSQDSLIEYYCASESNVGLVVDGSYDLVKEQRIGNPNIVCVDGAIQ